MYNVQLRNIAALLSDNHAEITTHLVEGKEKMSEVYLEEAAKLMEKQSARMLSAADEVREIIRKAR